jgi:hypothetical protein
MKLVDIRHISVIDGWTIGPKNRWPAWLDLMSSDVRQVRWSVFASRRGRVIKRLRDEVGFQLTGFNR